MPPQSPWVILARPESFTVTACIRLLNAHSQATQPGPARWALHLLADLAPLLDWKITLANARFPDPTTAAEGPGQSGARLP